MTASTGFAPPCGWRCGHERSSAAATRFRVACFSAGLSRRRHVVAWSLFIALCAIVVEPRAGTTDARSPLARPHRPDAVASWPRYRRRGRCSHHSQSALEPALTSARSPDALLIGASVSKTASISWSRVGRGGVQGGSEPLDQFIGRKGGINARAARFFQGAGKGSNLASQFEDINLK
jgi:hypothetical protein